MSDFKARINRVIYFRTLPNSYLNFPDPPTMPTHCSVVDRTRMTWHQINNVVPVIQDPPAPNIMDPVLQCGLYNPNAYVRGGAVEAMGKMHGVKAMKGAKMEERDAKARVKHHASEKANVRYILGTLTDEELAAFEELVEEEAIAAAGEDGDEGERAELGKEREKPVVGAAASEKLREEKTAEVEREGRESAVGAAPVKKAGEEKGEGKKPGVGAVVVEKEGAAAAGGTGNRKAAEKQNKKKQAKSAPLGTAWFLQRGKELDSKRAY